MLAKRLIKSNDAGGGACTNTVDLYNPFPDGGGVALYQLNGDATDVSGNYDGTWSGTAAYTTGVFGQSADFNASNYISVPTLSGISQYRFTQSFWMKTTSTAVAYVTSFRSPIYMGFGHKVYTSNYSFLMYDGTTIYNLDITPSVLNDGSWHNVVATYNGSNLILYVDGQFYNSLALSNATPFDGSVNAIGGRASGGYKFTGQVDQVRVFSRALRPYEVEALYTEEYCTPTIVPSEHFNTVTYTAATTNGTYQITGSSFQPDFIWVKNRDNVEQHYLIDSVRGLTNMTDKFLQSSTSNTESSASAMVNGTTVTAIPGGFEVVETSINSGEFYFNGRDYVAWNFKAAGYANTFNVLENGSTTSSATAAGAGITAGSNTNNWSVSANRDAGFSIVKWTYGNSINTVGHGLDNVPKLILIKSLDVDSVWQIYAEPIGNNQKLMLGGIYGDDAASGTTRWDNTDPTSDVFTFRDIGIAGDLLAYCFAEVEGFSNFGSYVGNGSTSGPTIVTGFEPAFVMIKNADDTGDWAMFDNKRNPTNPVNNRLMANLSSQESQNSTTRVLNFLTNGFSINSTNQDINAINDNYIYMAFAADPTTIEPTLEDSFNTVLYTGNGENTKQITDVGFQPDFLWFKSINDTYNHVLYDSIRGTDNILNSNTTVASEANYNRLRSFDNNGFTLFGNNAGDLDKINRVNVNYVAWAWKGAELPAINSNGSIPSVVSANPAAGFSIVSYTGNGNAATIGHGLNLEPSVVIVKNREDALGWMVYHSSVITATSTNKDYLELNTGDSIQTKGSATTFEGVDDNTIALGTTTQLNRDGDSYIAYCFHSVPSFSKIGSYIGDGTKTGPIITTGFRPAWVMIKWTDDPNNSSSWTIYSNKINTGDVADTRLVADTSGAEVTSLPTDTNVRIINFSDTGFEIAGNSGLINSLNGTYIYMAFANQF